MANPFYINPNPTGVNIGGQLAQLGQTLGNVRRQDEQKQAQQAQKDRQRQIGADLSKMYENRDSKGIADYMIANPDVASQTRQAVMSAINADTKQNQDQIKSDMFQVLQIPNVEDKKKFIAQKINDMHNSGQDARMYMRELGYIHHDPNNAQKDLEVLASTSYPNEYNQYHKTVYGDQPKVGTWQKIDLGGGRYALGNTVTGETKSIPGSIGESYQNTYDKMLVKNPNQAHSFGLQHKLITATVKQNANGSYSRIFSDGTQDTIQPTDQVQVPGTNFKMSVTQAQNALGKASDAQRKTAQFALTLDKANATIDKILAKKDFKKMAIEPAIINRYLEGSELAKSSMTPDQQLFYGSIENMINAISRSESGAGMTEQEEINFRKRYMPSPGDTKERVNQKLLELKRYQKLLRGRAGAAYPAVKLLGGIGKPKGNTSQYSSLWGG
jgi:hypothetical protein